MEHNPSLNSEDGFFARTRDVSPTSIVYGEQSSEGNESRRADKKDADFAATLSGGGGGRSRGREGDGTGVGRQGLGTKAGSRIKWSWDPETSTSVAVYYNDAGGDRQEQKKLENNGEEEVDEGREKGSAEEEPEQERKDTLRVEGQELEYLGCFRDQPGSSREFSRADSRRETDDSQEREEVAGLKYQPLPYRQSQEDDDSVFVFARSLTPNVREISPFGILQQQLISMLSSEGTP